MITLKFRKLWLLAGLLTMMLALGCSEEGHEKENLTGDQVVHIAIQPSCAFIPLYVARANGWMEEAMKEIGVQVEWTDFESGPPMNESMATGKQDIAVMGDVPAVANLAAGQKSTLIAAETGMQAYALLVTDKSGIQTVADLKGKKIAAVIGSTAQNLTQKLLVQAGISPQDVTIVNMGAGDALSVLQSGEIAAIASWEPNVSRLAALDGIHILADGSKVNFRAENVLLVRSEYLEKHPEVVKVFLQQYVRGIKALEQDPQGCSEKIASYFGLDAKLLEATLAKYGYIMKFEDEDVAALQDTVQFLLDSGNIQKNVEVRNYVDDSLVRGILHQEARK